jgi:hypothetical protein
MEVSYGDGKLIIIDPEPTLPYQVSEYAKDNKIINFTAEEE